MSNKHNLLATLALSTSLLACGRAPQIIAVQPGELEKPGQMTVTGTATLQVSPDCADLTMTLTADDPRPGAATTAVDGKEHALVAALHQLGVENGDLKLSLVTLEPIYEPNPTGWARIKVNTYRAQITVTATTHDFGKIATLMQAGADAGASQMSSQFRNSELPELKKKVRAMALAAAKDKAKQTADALDVKIGRIVSVGENIGGMMWNQPYFPQAMENAVATRNSGDTLGGTLQPLTLDVTIGFELAKT